MEDIKPKSFNPLSLIIVTLLVIALGLVAFIVWFFLQQKQAQPATNKEATEDNFVLQSPYPGKTAREYATLLVYAPEEWKTRSEEASDSGTTTIYFWRGQDKNDTPIKLQLLSPKDSLQASGLERSYQLTEGLMAAKVDLTPQETNYYFEKYGQAYHLSCTHNQLEEIVSLCESILKTAFFKDLTTSTP